MSTRSCVTRTGPLPIPSGSALLSAAVATGLLAGCATAQPIGPAFAGAGVVSATLHVAGRDHAVDWFVPDADIDPVPAALVTVQHGFTRNCGNVRDTGLRIAAAGLLALCVEASMVAGNPALAEALAAALADGSVQPPGGQPLPRAIIAGGHSAGGHFASRLGWALATLAPDRIVGLLLFDPVAAGSSFAGNLAAVSAAGQRPVLAISANASGCNAQHNAYPALRQVQAEALAAGADGFVGLQLSDDSSHVDVEGGNSNLVGIIPCGAPRPRNTDALRTLAARWAADMAVGARSPAYYPGGPYVDALVARGAARRID